MGAFGGLILTNKGRALQAKAQAGAQLQYTKIKIGDGNLGGQSIPTLTDLISPKKTLGIRKIEVRPGGIAVVSTVLSNADITEGFYFREIGVFAEDPDVGEILYCYANAGANAEYIPPGGGPDIIEKHIDIRTLTGNAQNVSAQIDQSLIWATQQELADALQEAKDYADNKIETISFPVTSVNGKTGDVVLNASDVGAPTLQQHNDLQSQVNAHLNEIVTEAAPGKIPRADANGKIDNDWLNGLLIGNNPACRVYTAINQSVPDNGDIHIAFELEYFDNDNIHDVAVNNTRLTCRTPGKYLIIGQVVWEPKTSGDRLIGIRLNGSTFIGQVYGPPSPNGQCQQVVSTIFDLNAGDYVELRVRANNVGSPIYIGGDPRPSFMMVKVG